MSELSTRIREFVSDPATSDTFRYGPWGALTSQQRKQIRELCDLCDVFENAADNFGLELDGVMHSVDKWLDGEELKQDKVNRAATMREKTLRIVESAEARIAKELLTEIEIRLPTSQTFHNSDIQLGYAWAMTSVQRLLNEIKAERILDVQDTSKT